MSPTQALHWADYIVLVGFLLISLGIGIYHSLTGGRQRTTQEFFLANRKLAVIPTALSTLVSFQSAIHTLGSTAEVFLYGGLYMICAGPTVALAILLVERFLVPWIYPQKFISINDYLERRYESKAVRVMASVIAIIGAIFYMGSSLYAPSTALETVTGFSISVSIPVMGIVGIAYTALGGIKAVIWTDVFQFVTMIVGTLAILIKGSIVVGGFSRAIEISTTEGRFDFLNWWSPDPTERHTIFGFFIGFTMYWGYRFGLSQAGVQRYSSLPTIGRARVMMLLNIPPALLLFFLSSATGVVVFAYFSLTQCDPLKNKDVSSPNQLLALFVNILFAEAPGFIGLFLATLYGGALSSFSSALSGAAANCWDDILKLKLASLQEHQKALLNKVLVIIFGVLGSTVAYLTAISPGPIIQVNTTFLSTAYGPLLGIFLLGGLSKHANYKGALTGGITALIISSWLAIGSLQLKVRQPTLPSLSTEGCIAIPAGNISHLNNGTKIGVTSWPTAFTHHHNSFELTTSAYNFTGVADTASQLSIGGKKKPLATELSGLGRFYALSYLWYTLFGAVSALIIGALASLIFRDREAESRVDSRLLIPLRQCLNFNLWVGSENLEIPADDDYNGTIEHLKTNGDESQDNGDPNRLEEFAA